MFWFLIFNYWYHLIWVQNPIQKSTKDFGQLALYLNNEKRKDKFLLGSLDVIKINVNDNFCKKKDVVNYRGPV